MAEEALRPQLDGPIAPVPAKVWFAGQMRIVWGVVLLYIVGFIGFYPRALTNFDEVSYVRQAAAFAAGSGTVDSVDPFTGQHQRVHPSDYPAGTSTLMVPLVWLAGWRGAFLLGLLALSGATLFTARWIADSGGSPLYALAVLGYLPAMVMARTGMSDLPSACLVAAGLWLFWADDQSTPWRRIHLPSRAQSHTLCDLFRGHRVPPGTPDRCADSRRSGGVACGPLSAALVYGNPFFAKDYLYGFSGLYAGQNLAMYLTALLVLVPGGLIFALFYRGKCWIDLVATVVIYVAQFIDYNYNGGASGGLKQWMLSLRFLIPLTPIVAFAMAHTCTLWYRALARSLRPESRITLQRAARGAVAVWVIGDCRGRVARELAQLSMVQAA
jgi:hypothetical protein